MVIHQDIEGDGCGSRWEDSSLLGGVEHIIIGESEEGFGCLEVVCIGGVGASVYGSVSGSTFGGTES